MQNLKSKIIISLMVAGCVLGVACKKKSSSNTTAGSSTPNPINPLPVGNKPVLVVNKLGSGQGTVTSSPSGISCGGTCSDAYDMNSNVTLNAVPLDNTYVFSGWSGVCSGTGTCTVHMSTHAIVNAKFDKVQKALTVSVSGSGKGSIASSPTGISCGLDCNENYDYGSSIQLIPTPSDGFSLFDHWEGACSGQSACTVLMNQPQNVTAAFNKVSLNGTWTGITSQGYPITLTIANEAITSSSTTYKINGSYCSATIQTASTYGTTGLVIDANHSFSGNWITSAINGTFTNSTTGSGSFYESESYCNGSANVSYTLTKTFSSVGISALGVGSGYEHKQTVLSRTMNQ